MLEKLLKIVAVTSLVLGGVVVGATIFAAKGIDKVGDKLGEELHS